MIKIFIIFFLYTSTCFANYFRSEAEYLNSNAYLINFQTSYFQTLGFYDDQGIIKSMPVNNQFGMLNSDLKISYGISNLLEIAGSARLRNVTSSNTNINTGQSNLTKTGAESGAIFFKYHFPKVGNLFTGIGLRYRQTLYTNTKYDPPQIAPDSEIVLGDDGSEYAVDFFSTFLNSSFKFIGNFSYQSPANNLSPEIIYKLEAQYLFTKLSFIFGLDGIYSLNKDPYTSLTKPRMSVGATHLFNSINRARLAPYIGTNYSFKKFAIGLEAQTVMKGVSTDSGNSIAFNISTGSEGVTPESIKIKAFKEYHIDGSVLKISAKGNFLKIDQGLSSDVEKGMKFDIYQTDYFGGNLLIASGVIVEVGADWSNIKLEKKFKDIEIKPGFAARGY